MNLSYVTLFVGDLPACQRFYREGLGLGVLHDSPSFVQFRTGGTALSLHATTDPARCSRGVNLHFDVADVAEAVAQLRGRGVDFDGEPEDEPWGARVTRTHDPAGNAVEIVEWLNR